MAFAESLIKLAGKKWGERGVIAETIRRENQGCLSCHWEKPRYDDLLEGRVDVNIVVRLERKNDNHAVSNKTFDFSETTTRQLIQDGYKEAKEQMYGVL